MLIGCNKEISVKEQKQTEATQTEIGSYESISIGSASFTIDDTKSVSVQYTPGGTDDSTLSVTDNKGLIWRLDIPKNALQQSQNIKMTAMNRANVDTLGAMAGGIVLEPDGLIFLEPAKLTVTGEDVNVKSLLLTGNKDGSNLNFICCENKDGEVSADIFHFSTVMLPNMDEDTQIKNITVQVDEQQKNAVKNAYDILKRPIDEPPIPPDISLKCKKGTHDLDMNQYYNQFLQNLKEPEMSAVTQLLGAERSKQILGTSQNDDSMEIAAKLLERLRTKIKILIDKYQGQPEKFYSTAAAFTQVENMYLLAGGQDDTDWFPLIKWCENVTRHYLSELTDKHDYTSIHALVRAAKTLELIGGDGYAYLSKIENALKFDLSLDINMRTMADYYFKYELTATIPINLTLGGDFVVGEGLGTCEYSSVTSPIGQFISPSSYPCEAIITEFDPCMDDIVKLSLDKIGSENETWYFTLSGQTVTDDNTSQWLANMLFANETSTSFDFSTNLKNLNVNAVDETINKTAIDEELQLEGSIHITMVHKPSS